MQRRDIDRRLTQLDALPTVRPRAALIEGRRLERLARALRYRTGESAARLVQAEGLHLAGRHSDALALLHDTLPALRRLRDGRRLARAYSVLGCALQALGDADGSLQAFLTQLQASSRRDDAWEQVLAATNLSGAYLARGNVSAAEEVCQQVLGRVHEAPDLAASVHNNLGVALGRQGSYDGAIQHYRIALQTHELQGNLVYALLTATNLARCLVLLDRLDDAEAELDRVQRQARAANANLALLNGWLVRAALLERRKDSTGAVRALQKMLSLAQAEGNQQYALQAHRALADLFERLRQWQRALKHLRAIDSAALEQHAKPAAAWVAVSRASQEAATLRRRLETVQQRLNALGDSVRSDAGGPAPDQPRGRAMAPLPQLSSREREVLEGLFKGHDNVRIGADLGLSRHTVRHYVSGLIAKFGARNRTEVVAQASALNQPINTTGR